MAPIRLYLAVLTLALVLALVTTTTIGVLEAIVMTAAPLLLILDMIEDLRSVRLLEEQIAALES